MQHRLCSLAALEETEVKHVETAKEALFEKNASILLCIPIEVHVIEVQVYLTTHISATLQLMFLVSLLIKHCFSLYILVVALFSQSNEPLDRPLGHFIMIIILSPILHVLVTTGEEGDTPSNARGFRLSNRVLNAEGQSFQQ